MAVRLDHNIVVISGSGMEKEALSHYRIWTFNLFTEHWNTHDIKGLSKETPAIDGACIAAIGKDLCMFGGRKIRSSEFRAKLIRMKILTRRPNRHIRTNSLWKLRKSPAEQFECKQLSFKFKPKKAPSPRFHLTGWAYNGYFWAFGGRAIRPFRYLNDHGDFINGCSNQLFRFNPRAEKWSNPKCHGAIPSPCSKHATTINEDKVWLIGGYDESGAVFDELFELDMDLLIWTQIQANHTKPKCRYFCTLTAISDTKLVLHGGRNTQLTFSSTWILDLPSLTWTMLRSKYDHP